MTEETKTEKKPKTMQEAQKELHDLVLELGRKAYFAIADMMNLSARVKEAGDVTFQMEQEAAKKVAEASKILGDAGTAQAPTESK